MPTPNRDESGSANQRLREDVARAGGYKRYIGTSGELVHAAFWWRLACIGAYFAGPIAGAFLRERGALRLAIRALLHRTLLDLRRRQPR